MRAVAAVASARLAAGKKADQEAEKRAATTAKRKERKPESQ